MPTSADLIKLSQQDLGKENTSHHTHLTSLHDPGLQGELDANTANDYPYTQLKEAHFNPGLARTNAAATVAKPQGTTQDNWNERHKHLTVMQQHCVCGSYSSNPLL